LAHDQPHAPSDSFDLVVACAFACGGAMARLVIR
jgi:hypothetical protein